MRERVLEIGRGLVSARQVCAECSSYLCCACCLLLGFSTHCTRSLESHLESAMFMPLDHLLPQPQHVFKSFYKENNF